MTAKTLNDNVTVSAVCPNCEQVTSFEYQAINREYGLIDQEKDYWFKSQKYYASRWRLLRCAGCGRAGLAQYTHGSSGHSHLMTFYPQSQVRTAVPDSVPDSILKELHEVEDCISTGAFRGGSALLRSVLEKTLKENGYTRGNLVAKIDSASDDGVITASRKRKAHEDIRVLGNEIVHDEWREVTVEEVSAALHYSQRILEDFYDDRESVMEILVDKGRLKPPPEPSTTDE